MADYGVGALGGVVLIDPGVVPPAASPIKAWRGGQYVDCDTYGWDGTKYVPIDISGGL